MRKRYTRKYRDWSPRFKWNARDFGLLTVWERERKEWLGKAATPDRKKRT
jgi:hypothetical protein